MYVRISRTIPDILDAVSSAPMTPGHGGNVRLRTARELHGYTSQKAFADALNATAATLGEPHLAITARTVRRWESSNPPRPRRVHAQAVEQLLGRPLGELGFPPSTSATNTSHLDSAESNPTSTISDTLADATITDYEQLTQTYQRLSRTLPPGVLNQVLTGHTALGQALLNAAHHQQRKLISNALAQAWLLIGRSEQFDNDDPSAASAALTAALQHAHSSEDDQLAAAVLAHLALLTSTTDTGSGTGDPLRMAQSLCRKAGTPPHLQAWLYATESDLAQANGHSTEALRLANIAEATLARSSDATKPPWLDWLTPHRIASLKAGALLAAGRTADARSTLESALHQLSPELTKPQVLLLSDLAEIAAFDRDADGATQYLSTAVRIAEASGHDSTAKRILSARDALSPWDGTPTVNQLDDELVQWRATLDVIG